MGQFSAAVSKFVREVPGRAETVVKESTQRVVSEAQTPLSEGGRMPVRSAFLRNSGISELNSVPRGPSRLGDGNPGEWDVGSLQLTLQGYQLADTIYFGWTAIYARKIEEQRGFVEAAAMRWPSIVEQVARELETRIRG